MILAGTQPSAVWFRVLQDTAAPACDRLCGGCLTVPVPHSWLVCGVLHTDMDTGRGGKVLEPGSPWGWIGKALCFLWPCLVLRGQLRWQLTGRAGHAWAWAGPFEKLPSGTVGLAGSCHGPFWGALQLQPCRWDASAFQSSSGGREQPGEGTLLGQQDLKQPGQVVFPEPA